MQFSSKLRRKQASPQYGTKPHDVASIWRARNLATSIGNCATRLPFFISFLAGAAWGDLGLACAPQLVTALTTLIGSLTNSAVHVLMPVVTLDSGRCIVRGDILCQTSRLNMSRQSTPCCRWFYTFLSPVQWHPHNRPR